MTQKLMFSELYRYRRATEQQREQVGICAEDYYDLNWFQQVALNVEGKMYILNRIRSLYIS